MGLHTTQKIADFLGVDIRKVYNTISETKMMRYSCINGINYFTDLQLNALKDIIWKREIEIVYYPLKTTETFYIYESKINVL